MSVATAEGRNIGGIPQARCYLGVKSMIYSTAGSFTIFLTFNEKKAANLN
jgi:hypothetical protein